MAQYLKDRKREAVTPAAFSKQSMTTRLIHNEGRNLSSPDNGMLPKALPPILMWIWSQERVGTQQLLKINSRLFPWNVVVS